jgi:hypothetical protein
MENGSLFIGPKFSAIEDTKEREELMQLAYSAIKEEAIDVSRLFTGEDFGDLRFYVNNRIEDALEILQEIDEEF